MAKGLKTGGRKVGSTNKVSVSIREVAQQHAPKAIQVLFDIMSDEKANPTTRVQAANALLERGYGKPRLEDEPLHTPENNKLIVQFVESDGNGRPLGLSQNAAQTIRRDILGIHPELEHDDN